MKKLLIGLLAVASLLVIASCSSSPDYHFSIGDSDYYSDDEALREEIWAESSGGSSSYPDSIEILIPPPEPSDTELALGAKTR